MLVSKLLTGLKQASTLFLDFVGSFSPFMFPSSISILSAQCLLFTLHSGNISDGAQNVGCWRLNLGLLCAKHSSTCCYLSVPDSVFISLISFPSLSCCCCSDDQELFYLVELLSGVCWAGIHFSWGACSYRLDT